MTTAFSPLWAATARVLSTGGSILCYHSLTTPESPSAGVVNLPLAEFENHVALVRDLSRIVPLREILERVKGSRTTAGLTAITFDDAYSSLLLAREFLDSASVPITVFVVTDAARAGSAYWWDRVDDLFAHTDRPRWDAFEERLDLPRAFRDGQPKALGPLRPLRQWILAEFRGRWPVAFEPILRALEEEAGRRTLHRSMTFAEIELLARLPLVDFGVHTISHAVLPLLADDELRGEIAGCHDELRERALRTLPVLAIPFGICDDRTLRIAHDAGMSISMTVGGRTLGRFPGRALPRFTITNRERAWKLRLRVTGVADRLRSLRGEPRDAFPELPSPTS